MHGKFRHSPYEIPSQQKKDHGINNIYPFQYFINSISLESNLIIKKYTEWFNLTRKQSMFSSMFLSMPEISALYIWNSVTELYFFISSFRS